MNIICVYSIEKSVSEEKPLGGWYHVPYGISYIATSLKHAKHNVKMEVFTSNTNIKKRLGNLINEFKPEMLCLTAVTTQFKTIIRITEEVKKIDPSIFIIVGGAHTTLNPDQVIGIETIDAICIGEGERAVVAAASQLESQGFVSKINNIWVKNGQDIEKNPQDPYMQSLDSIPNIDREMWAPWIAPNPWHMNPDFFHMVLVGRGCPYKCTYCSNHALSKVSEGKYVRFRSVQSIIDEVKYIINRFPSVEQIYFEVETLNTNMSYVYDLCTELEKLNQTLKTPISFGTNFAVTNNVIGNKELFEYLKRANFKFINIGLESGSEVIRREVLKRPGYSNEDIIAFCKLANANSIKINMYALVGIPGETKEHFKQTVECVKACNVNNLYLSILYPYPGTDIYKTVEEMKLINIGKMGAGKERKKSYLCLPGFSKFQIKSAQISAYYKIFKNRWPFLKILLFIIIFNASTKNSTKLLGFLRKINNPLIDKYLSNYPGVK